MVYRVGAIRGIRFRRRVGRDDLGKVGHYVPFGIEEARADKLLSVPRWCPTSTDIRVIGHVGCSEMLV